MNFTQENVKKAFNKLTKKEKSNFFHDLEMELIKLPLLYDIYPPSNEQLDNVDLEAIVWIDDLTKTVFFNSLEIIRRGMVLLSLFATDRLHMEMEQTESYDRKAGVG